MTAQEIEARARELDKLEDELRAHAREVQERELAVKQAEKGLESGRIDYLFDSINKHRDDRRVVVEVPQVVIPNAEKDSGMEILTAVMATLAALLGLTTLLITAL